MMKNRLFRDLVIRTILIVAITDILIFRILTGNPAALTSLFVLEVIVVTIVPLLISLWFDLIYRKKSLDQ
jgi:hypothetical protein